MNGVLRKGRTKPGSGPRRYNLLDDLADRFWLYLSGMLMIAAAFAISADGSGSRVESAAVPALVAVGAGLLIALIWSFLRLDFED